MPVVNEDTAQVGRSDCWGSGGGYKIVSAARTRVVACGPLQFSGRCGWRFVSNTEQCVVNRAVVGRISPHATPCSNQAVLNPGRPSVQPLPNMSMCLCRRGRLASSMGGAVAVMTLCHLLQLAVSAVQALLTFAAPINTAAKRPV